MAENLDHIIPDNDQTRARRAHLEGLRELVGNAYPNRFARTHVFKSKEGEDTISIVGNSETIKGLIGKEEFGAAFDSLASKVKAGERPAAADLDPLNAELNRVEVRVSGRVATPPRVMGKAAFVHLSDGKERLQIYVRRDDARAVSNDTGEVFEETGSGWRLLQLLDHGDFVGVAGFLFVTKTGELSVHVREIQFLAKALVPMPDKVHGISDPEIGRRHRYVDLIASSLKVEREPNELTTREVFERRSRLITEMRRFLDSHGYVEVETPMLSPIASGAAARPFKTHHNALDIDLYARIAPELYLKRLLVGGFERVYELNRNFRNEGVGYRWNPEFTMLEFYCAYMDVNGMMDFCEEMLRTTIETATGGTRVRFGDTEINFGRKFERLSMKDAINKYWHLRWRPFGEDRVDSPNWLDDPKQVYAVATSHYEIKYKSSVSGGMPAEEAVETFMGGSYRDFKEEDTDPNELTAERTAHRILYLFEEIAESRIAEPTFITDFPKVVSPLSKASPDDPSVAERFELYVAGMEIANGFSELNDPVEQHERFLDQTRQRERGDEEAMQMDEDYIRALSYGMPPAAGIGIGIDRLVMLLTNRKSIRDVILFPHMRPVAHRQDEGTDERAEAVHRLGDTLGALAEGDEDRDDDEEPRAGLKELHDELGRRSFAEGRGDEEQ